MQKDFNCIVNPDIRPQDDLYHHVNDKWLRENPIPDEEDGWSNIHEMEETAYQRMYAIIEGLRGREDLETGSFEQKVRDFYISGSADTEYLEEMGNAVLMETFTAIDECRNIADIAEMTGRLHMMNIDVFWGIYIDQDEADSSQYLLRLCQAGLSLPDRDYYDQRQKKMKMFKEELEKHIPRMFQKIHESGVTNAVARDIYAFENTLAKASKTSAQLRDVEGNYNKMTFPDLQKMTSAIDWERYFSSLGITPPNYISVDQPAFFTSLDKTFAKADIAILRQYMKWHVLRSLSGYMGARIEGANFEFYGTLLNGTPQMKPLWKRLITVIDAHIGEAFGKLYVDQYFPPEAKARLDDLVSDVKSAFAERIQSIEWMKSHTKKYALEKLANTYVQIGYPDKPRTYEELDITADSYIHNCLNSAMYDSKRNLNKLGQPVDREEWEMTPPTVNACFSPNLNKITFPAGILQPPVFDFEADDAVNYGGIGVVIGHELTHGFDDEGSSFDAEGNLRQWRSESDKEAFDKRTRVVVEQANNHEVLNNRSLNGELTLGENIADIGGGEIAFQALGYALTRNGRAYAADGYTPEKRFFLNFARVWRSKKREELILQLLLVDPHAPPEFRVNNTVRNMQAFHDTFGVVQENALYIEPAKRASIW